MKSTSSALTVRKLTEFCHQRLAPAFTPNEIAKIIEYLTLLLGQNVFPPYRGAGLDLPAIAARLGMDLDHLRAHRASLQPAFDAVAREVSEARLKPSRAKPSPSGKSVNATQRQAPLDHAAQKPLTPRKRGARPKPIVDFPNALESQWDEPATFGAALQLHARRHGETIYHLYNAVVRPEDGVNRSTLISWGRGRKVPRAAISLEILGRIEHRYRLPQGYFQSLSSPPDRAPGDFDLPDITPAERRRIAWHLPEDFNRRSKAEKAEILGWVRSVIVSGSTDYRKYQAAAVRQRYAVRFICASGPVRKSSSASTPTESGIVLAPKRLNDEMAEILRFKTSTFAALGMQRSGVWGGETASQKVE